VDYWGKGITRWCGKTGGNESFGNPSLGKRGGGQQGMSMDRRNINVQKGCPSR